MSAYEFLLLWQGLLTGSSFWIRPAGWLWFLVFAALVICVEWVISAIARKKGLQAFSVPFRGTKYLQDVSLLYLQIAFTAALLAVLLVVFSLQGTWSLFWIDLTASVILGTLIAVSLSKNRD